MYWIEPYNLTSDIGSRLP